MQMKENRQTRKTTCADVKQKLNSTNVKYKHEKHNHEKLSNTRFVL